DLSERFDAEDVAAIQDRYFGSVRETIGRYGGSLEKFIGDAAMAVFGVPRSGDDDVERAVRAGLALTHAIQQIGAHLGLEDDALRLRVGINTGEVVVAASGPNEGRVTGDTVNTAARLQTAAPPGGVLIGEASALAVADVAEMEFVQPLELKGKAEPTAARLVIGMKPAASREQAMGALRAPMLGRESELELLSHAHERATSGNVERLLIVAPPGVGKSRLLREIAERIAEQPTGSGAGASVIWRSRARPHSLSPFDPIARLMGEALSPADVGRDAAASDLRRHLAAAGASDLRADVVVDACLALAWPPAATDEARPSDERSALFAAWIEGLNALAAGRTQVWLIEDIHWAGGDVLAFLDEASTASEGHERGGPPELSGRLVIATSRPSLLEAQPAWAAEDVTAARTVLHLSTLEATDAAGLVRALVGDALPDDLVERIAERSDGNCLFIEELLRTWVSVGALVPQPQPDGAGWRLTVPAGEIPLPQSVQSIYAAQLDDLPPAARRLARRASVAGRRFPVAALEPLGADAGDGLQPLRRRALVDGPVDEPVLGDAFSYRHALLRDAGYASLARAERARLHVRLARWLEAAAGDRTDEIAEQIAGHYSAALDSAPSLAREIDEGVDRDEVRRLAARWYERAGTGTLALSAHDAARQLFRRSIDLTPEDARFEQARRWERLGDATAFAADMDEGAAAYTKAMELYRQVIGSVGAGFDKGSAALEGASDALARQAEWLARISPEGAAALTGGAAELRAGAGEIQQGKADLTSSLLGARAGLARTASSLADVMYQQLQFEDSRRLAEQVLSELGDESDADSRARLVVAQAMGALGAGGPSPAIEAQMQRAVELAREGGDPRVELRALNSLTAARSEGGSDDTAAWQSVADAAEALGDWATFVSATSSAAMAKL
ncbi:MAG TPA: adenylate/guanylate cyclase domain-containing protein, partial [Candidatus Limnocylindrales bacterium]|nr:adenylate/guanylate cyclase domain-containing protein [Candidatus Limnocylindrales bacterium]